MERMIDSESAEEGLEVVLEGGSGFILSVVESTGDLHDEGGELVGGDGLERGSDVRVEVIVSVVADPERRQAGDVVVELVRDGQRFSERGDGLAKERRLGSLVLFERRLVVLLLPGDLIDLTADRGLG
jgi:hypothetical protein